MENSILSLSLEKQSCGEVVLDLGLKMTRQAHDRAAMWGKNLLCWQVIVFWKSVRAFRYFSDGTAIL